MICIPINSYSLIFYLQYYIYRNDFKDYSLQSRLHFRIHSAQSDLKKLHAGKKCDYNNGAATIDDCIEALDDLDLDKDCEFLDAEEGDFKDPEYLDSNKVFKTAITDEDARKIIEGKQLK